MDAREQTLSTLPLITIQELERSRQNLGDEEVQSSGRREQSQAIKSMSQSRVSALEKPSNKANTKYIRGLSRSCNLQTEDQDGRQPPLQKWKEQRKEAQLSKQAG